MLSRLNWTDAAKGRIAILKQYEPIQPYLLYELSKAFGAEIFLDVGANIGAYSILLASLPTIQEIHSFEPAPQAYAELLSNVGLNSYASKIKPSHIACSDQSGTLAFGVVSETSGANSIIDTSIHRDKPLLRQMDVKTMPLDTHLHVTGRTISIKVDVEGHELNVLRGASRTLADNHCMVQIEDYEQGQQEAATFLLSSGYRWLFNVGPDHYFSNMPHLEEGTLVRAFSAASTTAVSENFTTLDDRATRPVRISLPLGLAVEATGPLARRLRAIRDSLRA